MAFYEYKVIPAPVYGKPGKGIKGSDGRFANALSDAINEQAKRGWEYVRAESLPSQDRKGVTRKRIETFQNVLVFRKEADPSEIHEDDETPKSGFNPFKRFKSKEFIASAGSTEVRMTAEDETASDPIVLDDPIEDEEDIEDDTEIESDDQDEDASDEKDAKPSG